MLRRAPDLVKDLTQEGLSFSSFTVVHEGAYDPLDAEWNYKDVPHHRYIHQAMNARISYVSDKVIATITLQKLLGLRLPLPVVNYESSPNSQTYYTAFMFFVMVIESIWKPIGEGRTQVATTYNLGYPKILFFVVPLIKWIMRRNYKELMLGDTPMRERRGQVRRWGYDLKKPEGGYSFEGSMNVQEENVDRSNAKAEFEPQAILISEKLPIDGAVYLGRSDHLGLRVVRDGEVLSFFPRLCPHEGSCLDESPCKNQTVRCPWHGRTFKPSLQLQLGSKSELFGETAFHSVALRGDQLSVTLGTSKTH